MQEVPALLPIGAMPYYGGSHFKTLYGILHKWKSSDPVFKNWPQELQILAKNLDIENWQAMAHSGRKFRIGPNARLSESPEPHEFPLLLEPVTHEQLLEELEELQLQEELLREQLQLVELEKALNDEQQKLVAEAIQQAPKGCPLVVDLKLLFLGEVLLNI